MISRLDPASEKKLAGVNYRLADFIRQLSLTQNFRVTEGVRTKARQRQLYAEKKTRTLNSRHLVGRAVDIVPLVATGSGLAVSWEWQHFKPIIDAAKKLASELQFELVFGYDWGWDAPHIEMKEP